MKKLMGYFVDLFSVKTINYPQQMRMLKRLMETYTKEEIQYALDYYAKNGVSMYSLGYLSEKTMARPLKEIEASKVIEQWSDDSGERNKRKFAENNKTRSRKRDYFNLFEESE